MPAIPNTPAMSPRGSITLAFSRYTTSDVKLVVRLIALAVPFAFPRVKCAKLVRSNIRKVPVPGP